jgi:restriction endonuclease Mrr
VSQYEQAERAARSIETAKLDAENAAERAQEAARRKSLEEAAERDWALCRERLISEFSTKIKEVAVMAALCPFLVYVGIVCIPHFPHPLFILLIVFGGFSAAAQCIKRWRESWEVYGQQRKLERGKDQWLENRRAEIEVARKQAEAAKAEAERLAREREAQEAESARKAAERRRNVLAKAAEARDRLERQNWQDYHAPLATDKLHSMSGEEFEKWLAELLSRLGYREVELTPQSGDHGADLVALLPDKDEKVVIQAKRWRDPAGNKVIQEVLGGMRAHDAQHGVVAALGGFTVKAKELAEKPPAIGLWDGAVLFEMAASVKADEIPPFDVETYREKVLRRFYDLERNRLERLPAAGTKSQVILPGREMPATFLGPPEGIRAYQETQVLAGRKKGITRFPNNWWTWHELQRAEGAIGGVWMEPVEPQL